VQAALRRSAPESALKKTLFVWVACGMVLAGSRTAAQQDPRAAQPERPTVATHAYTVATGYAETEMGVQANALPGSGTQLAAPLLLKIGLSKRMQLDINVPLAATVGSGDASSAGLADWSVAVKTRVLTKAPVLADFSVQTALKFPTGSVASNRGTGTTDGSLILISSRHVGPISLDLNVGWTERSGDGTAAPRSATVWTVSTGFPVHGPVSWAAEVFGYPGTHGPAGQRPSIGLLTGPTFTVRPTLVLDAGVIVNLQALGANSAYAGVTWNIGRVF
jgi:hypothetical protein